ncbi:MAG: 3-phosphoshikimate 1-carboxyvinyltransferase [Streptococcaceae bacterium]|jgi:3-phosphoshikimate 1-carboxyvinyltransferase|nr:3-phosphoshikimate 1-carboxyvinyltransferase [Streptococcaceae bacterium]
MKVLEIKKALSGEISVSADKSISHRAVMLGSLARGKTVIHNLLLSEDVKATMSAFKALGVKMSLIGNTLEIEGSDFSLSAPDSALDLGNSGTTTRLIMGILASQNFEVRLIGDESLSKRPMNRVAIPLTLMGADIRAQGITATLPVTIHGGALHPLNFDIPVASAQVKTALIFAGLRAQGKSRFVEKMKTRDHTEKMLPLFGGKVEVNNLEIQVSGPQNLVGTSLTVAGDFSSAAFWIVAALIIPDSDILLKNIGINYGRTGLLDVVTAMGAEVELLNLDEKQETADIHVKYTEDLHATEISGELIPRCIDELPILSLLATQVKGETVIKDAKELRFKESDRISSIANLLSKMGAQISTREDGMIILGKANLTGIEEIELANDHRLVMTAIIASLVAKNGSNFPENIKAIVSTSYPDFFKDLELLCH